MPAWAAVDSPDDDGLVSAEDGWVVAVCPEGAVSVEGGWLRLGDAEVSVADVCCDAVLAVLVPLWVVEVAEDVADEDDAAAESGFTTTYRDFPASQRAHVSASAGRTSKRPTPPSQQPWAPAQQKDVSF